MPISRVRRQTLRLVALVTILVIGSAACASNAQVTVNESVAAAAPATTDAPTAQAAPTAVGAPAQPTDPTVPPAGRNLPAGFVEQRADSYSIAVPEGWTTLTDVADLDERLDSVASTGDFPADALEGYRSLLAGGDALVALGPGGDNFNAFRQPGTAAELGDPESVGREVENQFKTFAQDVSISAAPRFLGDLAGIMTSGQYSLNGQAFHLYQFATAHEDHVYFMTVTLLTGPDQVLADQILGSITFN